MTNLSLQLILEFISPFDKNLTVLYLGDSFNIERIQPYELAIQTARKDFAKTRNITLNPHKYHIHSLSDLYHDKVKHLFNKPIFLIGDVHFSNMVLNAYMGNPPEDEMEFMLLNKYFLDLNTPDPKYLFNTTINDIMSLFFYLDALADDIKTINYCNVDDFVAIQFKNS
jgi:hypothetical protein